MIGPRVLALVIAVVACSWFVLGLRALHNESSVRDFLTHHRTLTRAQLRSVNATLDEAAFLNPDEEVSTIRAIAYPQAGDVPGAIAIAKATVRKHPQDYVGWLVLEFVSRGTDPAAYRLARARLRALAPPVPRSR